MRTTVQPSVKSNRATAFADSKLSLLQIQSYPVRLPRAVSKIMFFACFFGKLRYSARAPIAHCL